jgi:hypothetical protein
VSACRSDIRPVVADPSGEDYERFFEGSAKVGQLIEGGGPDPAGIKVAHDEAVAFCPPKGVGEHLVRDAVERIIKFLVAATALL